MVTIDILNEFGADTKEGLARCMGNEDFYLKMVDMGINDERFESIRGIIESGDLDGAFEVAHALKGVLGNLALTPIYEPMSEITELLRARSDGDYATLCDKVVSERRRLLDMI